MEAYGGAADGSLTGTTAAQVAAILDMIEDHRETGKTMSARRVAAISAMIDDVAATAAEGTRPITRRRRSMCSARWYEKVCRLGEGGFGSVVRARQRSTGQDVAVKTLLLAGRGHDVVEDMLREACFMAACRGHPSLFGFRGVVRDPVSKEYSIVMDYVGQLNLAEVLYDRGRFPEAEVRRVMRHLLRGAKAMHENGIVHQDIKPANILIGDGGAIKIGDYGCAKSTAEQYPAFCYTGTNGYVAPEVLLETTDYDTAADMWSLGCVMAELLTDTLMFDGEDEGEQLYRIFDVLGVPSEKALKPQVLTEEVQQWRARQQRIGHRNLLRKMVPEKLLSRDGFEVLKGLLACDPRKRLTAAAALQFPWFTDHDVEDAALGHSIVVSKRGNVVTKLWSQLWQMAVSFAGPAIGFLMATASQES